MGWLRLEISMVPEAPVEPEPEPEPEPHASVVKMLTVKVKVCEVKDIERMDAVGYCDPFFFLHRG